MKLFRLVCFFALLAALPACRSSKGLTKPVASADMKRIEEWLSPERSFRSLESKVEFRLSAKQGVSTALKGTIRMRRDSCIILSFQPFAGIEALKGQIRKDTLVLVSRLHQVYSVESLRGMPYSDYLNLETLQAILSNRIFVPGDPHPNDHKLSRFERKKQKEGLAYRWLEDSFILDFSLNKDNQYSMLQASRPELNQSATATYVDFRDASFGPFPYQVKINTEGFKKNWSFQVNYLKPVFDGATDFRFEVPSKYKRVTTKELIERFQNML